MIIPNKIPISISRDTRLLYPLKFQEFILLIADTRAVCPYILE